MLAMLPYISGLMACSADLHKASSYLAAEAMAYLELLGSIALEKETPEALSPSYGADWA
ncbi:MAG: hypothetical protein ACRDA8_16080 [Shewanella sp.]